LGDTLSTTLIKDLAFAEWSRNPYVTARKICEKIVLSMNPNTKNLTQEAEIEYKTHGNYVNKLLSEFRSYYKQVRVGLPLKPLKDGGVGVTARFVGGVCVGRLEKRTFVWENVPRQPYVGGVDYKKGEVPVVRLAEAGWRPVLGNRNNMWIFRGGFGHVHWYKNGLVLLYLKGEFSQAALAKVKELFCKAFFFMSMQEVSKYLDVPIREVSRKWIFDVGAPMPRFKINHFERSHGLVALTDNSHPTCIHFLESVPFWIDEQKQVNDKLSSNIDGLSDTVGQMGLEIKAHLKLIRAWEKQSDASRKQSVASERVLNKLLAVLEPVIKKKERELEASERSQSHLDGFFK